MDRYATQFPGLQHLGLYAFDVGAQGNCLFHALADQLHGDPDRHLEIRARVIEHMREHGVYYKDFIGVFPGGGTRRNPRRSTTRSRQETPPPTAVEVDQAFERHLARMAEGGTFGDNLEVGAFARAYGVNVKIFQRDVAFFVTGESDDSAPKKTIHIAYHGPGHEHYSSIRNIDGPHEGLPLVNEKELDENEREQQMAAIANTPIVQDWMIETIQTVVPQITDRVLIAKTLEITNGDVETAAAKLMEQAVKSSSGSSSRSSSSEPSSNGSRKDLKLAPMRVGRSNSRQPRAAASSREDRRWNKEQHRRDTATQASQDSLSSTSTGSLPMAPDSDSESWRSSSFREGSFREGSVSSTGTSQKIPTRVKINPPRMPSPARKSRQKQLGAQRRRHLNLAKERRELLEPQEQNSDADSQSNRIESGFRTLIL